MKTSDYWSKIHDMQNMSGTGSTKRKQKVIEDMLIGHGKKQPYWALRFIVGNPLESWEGDVGAKKKTVRKAITDSFDANYDQVREIEKEKGNLSEVLTELDRPDSLTGRTEHEVGEVGFMVKEISERSGNQKIRTISSKFGKMENPQVLCYAMLNDISFGVGVATIKDALVNQFDVTRADLDRAHGIKPDISKLYLDIRNTGSVRTDVQPLDRIKPQKARKGSMDDADEYVIADTKYDGGRVLIHGFGDETRAYSRKQNEVTENLPELQEVNWPDTDFIFDAEAVGYDPETGEPLPFQKFMTRFQREHNIEDQMDEVEIKFKVFDALYWNGNDITRAEFQERLEIVKNSLRSENVADGGRPADEQYDKALNDGHEGLILKDKEAGYKFKRSSAWKKVKPVKEPVDVRVVGVIRGTGKFSDTLGALKVESRDGTHLGRVGTGFKDHDRDELWEMHQEGDLEGKIVELEFEELQERDGSYGLRFPRYVRLRPEGEADDLERVKQL